jgi:uncharacterized protein (TIGR00369 family)
MKLVPEHGPCFVCGTQNPQSIGLRWYLHDDGKVTADITLTLAQQGPPTKSHGGASAAMIDEAMGIAVWAAGHRVVAANLNIDYKRPVPLGEAVSITGWVVREEGRKVFTEGEIRLSDGQVAVSGTGLFVRAEHLFGAWPKTERAAQDEKASS